MDSAVKNMNLDSKTVKILTWKDVKKKVISLNPSLGAEIDQVKGVDDFKVIVATYPFGAPIIRKGLFFLNLDGDFVSYKNSAIPHEIRDLLDYNWLGIPFGMVLHNTFESHVDIPSHTVPLYLLAAGRPFSLLTIFEKKGASHHIVGAQSATAGCRSLITLPSIAHAQYSERLTKKFHLANTICPKELPEQWELFKNISESKSFRSTWECELLFFSKDFITALETENSFKEDLLDRVWEATSFSRHNALYELVFSIFMEDSLPLSIRNSAPVIETVKHILKIALKQAPAYTPCVSEMAGPVSGFMKALIEVYRIRYYWPLFMELGFFDDLKPVYYSLQKHTFLHTIPQKNATNNKTIIELKEIKEIIELFRQKVLDQELPISLKGTALYKMFKDVEFDYFHPHTNESGIISDIGLLALDDKRFLKLTDKFATEKQFDFPVKSIFFNGCIRVRPSTNQ